MFYMVTNEGFLDNIKAFITKDYGSLAKTLGRQLTKNRLDEDKLERMKIYFVQPSEIQDLIDPTEFLKTISELLVYMKHNYDRPNRGELERLTSECVSAMHETVKKITKLKDTKFKQDIFSSGDIHSVVEIVAKLNIMGRKLNKHMEKIHAEKILDYASKHPLRRTEGRYEDINVQLKTCSKYIHLIMEHWPKACIFFTNKYIGVLKKATKAISKEK